MNKVLYPKVNQLLLQARIYNAMAHHHHEEKENLDSYFYIIALLTGLFVGFVIDRGLIYIPIGGVLGLLTAALFLKFLVRGRHDA